MSELLPVIGGVAVGMLCVFVRPGSRLPVGAVLVLVLGILATIVSGEYLVSWAFLLVDVPLVAVSAVAGFLCFRSAFGLGRPPKGGT